MAAAHEQGITHRDLKPENVMVSDEGRVKVLDHRSDVFSLGVIFYEMLLGQRPFAGDTPAEVLSSVVKDEPNAPGEARADIPRELSKIVMRCLSKDASRRFQSTLDICNELEELKADLGSGELLVSSPQTALPGRRWMAVAGVALVLGVVGLFLWGGSSTDVVPNLVNPVQVTSVAGVEDYPTWAPDGSRIAYESDQSGNWDIWVSQVGGRDSVNLTADHEGEDRFPSWSPDGRAIAFLSRRHDVWGLYAVSALGGPARKLAGTLTTPPTGFKGSPQWSDDGRRIAVVVHEGGDNTARIVTLETQDVEEVALPDHATNNVYDLSWSRDGARFAYVEAITTNAEINRIWVVSSSGGEPSPVTDGFSNDWSPTWSSDGRHLYFISNRGGTMDLWREVVDESGRPQGELKPVTAGIEMRTAVFVRDGSKLAYARGRRENVSTIWRVPILRDRLVTWADAEQMTFDNAFIQFFDVSLDGKRLVFSSDRAGNQDLWVMGIEDGDLVQLTTDPTPDWNPRWSPDGNEIVFYAYRSGNREIWVMPSDGGSARQLTNHPAEDIYPTWSPDGSEVAFVSRRSGRREVWVVPIDGGEPRKVTTEGSGAEPEWSPDGGWLGVGVDRGFGRVRWDGTDGVAPLIEGPGATFRWSPDGKFIYYTGWRTRDGLWEYSLEDGAERRLTDFIGKRGRLSWNLATDGRHLYFHWDDALADIWVMDVEGAR